MLPASMQDAIKARAVRQKSGFKDPYVKRKMSKEEFLVEKQQQQKKPAGMSSTSGGTTSVDLQPLLQSQQALQAQVRELVQSVRQIGGTASSTASDGSTLDISNQLDQFKRELRQDQRKAQNEFLSSIQDVIMASNGTNSGGSSSSTNNQQQIARLQRELRDTKQDLTTAQDENASLRRELDQLRSENQRLQKSGASSTSTSTPTRSSKPSWSPNKTTQISKLSKSAAPSSSSSNNNKPNSSNGGVFQVTETTKQYELALNLPGITIADVKISYGGGALELKARGQEYKFPVDASKIDAGSISATLQASGGLQIVVPKK